MQHFKKHDLNPIKEYEDCFNSVAKILTDGKKTIMEKIDSRVGDPIDFEALIICL